MRKTIWLLCIVATVTGCASRSAAPAAAPARDSAPDENLNAVLWVQSALEFKATALQAFRLAQLQLDNALKDPDWTAALEQTNDAAHLPPAVIVDIDETVLDNSYYQARMIRDGTAFSPATWDAWVEEERATAIPGAVEFARYAAKQGVTVFYVTNRTENIETPTRRNLSALGFPVPADVDTVLTRGERPEWEASGKTPRRAFVARNYRVLLLVGDDLGDFIDDPSGTPAARLARTAAHEEWWGRRWIVIPNPTYGSWERAILGNAKDPIAAKRAALVYEPQNRRKEEGGRR